MAIKNVKDFFKTHEGFENYENFVERCVIDYEFREDGNLNWKTQANRTDEEKLALYKLLTGEI